MNSNENISGKRLTFFQLIQEYHIQIPIIQRDYAQGRITAHEIRDSFLDALLAYLEEDKKHRDLDFVYGNRSAEESSNEKKFIPLDGQQRLTTLFLLHWYLATKDGEIEELRKYLVFRQGENQISKFSYETRTSSKEFCDSLLLVDVNLDDLLEADVDKNNSLSKTIKDSNWYFLSWETDPTIQSMLIMLDDIHNKFIGKTDFFQKLIRFENPVITFQFLDLKEFNLTDDLYIKMNARGIPLSPFENFKAKFEQLLKESDFNLKHSYTLIFDEKPEQVDVKTYFSHKIDTDWTNLFWKHSFTYKKQLDKLIMNFFRAIVVNNYAASSDKSIDFLKHLIDNEDVSFQQYSKNACLNEKTVIDLITILDLIENGNQKVKNYLSDSFYYDEAKVFDILINNDIDQAGYIERIKFHAYCQYLIEWKTDKGFEDIEGLKKWMRVVYNLIENTAPYNDQREFSNSIQGINQIIPQSKDIQLIPQSNDILHRIITLDKIGGFDGIQFKEEKIKAHLILKDNKWDELIYSIEKHKYFKGQTGFILFLSGIEKYFNTNNHCSWSEQEDNHFKTQFSKYKDIALKIFNEEGINTFPNFIWERALLAKGDYLITSRSNQCFLINFGRDISWKRFLKRDKHEERSEIIEQIFNEIDKENINSSLETIIGKYNGSDWRSRFINTPLLFDYLGPERYVRKDSNHGFVLLKGKTMGGENAELYSYSFFLDNLKDKEFAPFTSEASYSFVAGNDENEYPCAVIESWYYDNITYSIDILYDENKFKLRFFSKEIASYSNKLIDVLKKHSFTANDESSYVINVDEEKILEKLKALCGELQSIS